MPLTVKSPDYKCPRCGYHTEKRSSMKTHFTRQKTCLPTISNIKLNEDIVARVLADRVYSIEINVPIDDVVDLQPIILTPTQSHHVTDIQPNSIINVAPNFSQPGSITNINDMRQQQVFNIQNILNDNSVNVKNMFSNYNLIQKVVDKKTTIDKVSCILEYKGEQLMDYDETLENLFKDKNYLIEDKSSDFDHSMNKNQLLDCIDISTRINGQINNFNVVYEKDTKRIKIYDKGEWTTYLEGSGISKVLEVLRLNYLNDYELYLLRKIHDGLCKHKPSMEERLEIYYKFLYSFDMIPHCEGRGDRMIMDRPIKENNEFYIAEYGFKIFAHVKETTTKSEKKELFNTVLHVIRSNTVANIKEINLVLISILNMDSEYRHKILPKLLGPGLPLAKIEG